MGQKLRFCMVVGLVVLLVGCPSSNPEAPSLEGVIYNDANANGQQDTGETGLAGWTIYLDANNNAKLDTGEATAQSSEEGKYRFTTLTSGNYTVRQVMPFGWRNVSGGEAPALAVTANLKISRANTFGFIFNLNAPRIVGGVDADVANFPFITALLQNDADGNPFQFCGGALISDTWILTASHCLADSEGAPINPSEVGLAARLGSSDRTKDGQVVNISRVILHPQYTTIGADGEPDTADDGPPAGYDIALLELAQPVTLSNTLYTLEMLTPELASLTADNTLATAIGWGALFSGGPSPDRLQVVHVPVANPQQCLDANQQIFDIQNFETQICAGVPEGGIDSCQGDSGGPLLVRSQDNSRWYHAGATSYGQGCGFRNFPGLYARTSVLSNWVKETAALPSRGYAVSIEGNSSISNINFGNSSTTRPFVGGIEPRYQLTNISTTKANPAENEPVTYTWNIIDEGSSTFSCNIDLDGFEAGQSIDVPCQKGANQFTSPAGYTRGVYLPQLTLTKGDDAAQSRRARVFIGDPTSDSFSGSLTVLDDTLPNANPNIIQYVDYYSLDLTGVAPGRAVVVQVQTEDFDPIVALLDGNEADFESSILTVGATEFTFVYDPTITNYVVAVTTQRTEQTGSYVLITTEGTLTP